ncbi:MFS transporter [Actinocrispum wychmicini]|uniref:Putative MFS family arabinose efflux permease n=1 Tax=Actinocrispum wychmicini TaxID=1213861 RepID=A0A4V2S7N6_9PSEU|nr:MFS transporter [Actinocrispum wychmicini]TCO60710.1 putative MFS family arabinose efflux permease [Actinocrispum wychmicini]
MSPQTASSQEHDPPKVRANRNEWLLVTFTATTNVADAVTRVALPLLAVQLTHSPALIALVAVLLTLPWLLTALHVGVFVDRKNRRTLMFGAETARMIAIGVLLVCYMTDLVSLPLIYVVAIALGVAEVVAMTSGASIIPSAIPKARWQTAGARITAVEYLCNGFVGAPIGGVLVAAGFGIALGTTSVIYVLGAVLLLLLVGNFRVEPTRERRSMNLEIKDGLTFLWRQKLLRTMALLIAVMAGCWAAWLAVIPAFAIEGPLHLSERQYGLLLTCLGAGGVLGTVVVGPINRLLGRRWSMFVDIIGSFALVATPVVVPAAPSSAIVVGIGAFLAGLGGTMWTVNARVIYQTLVPNDMLGRFSAASRLVGWGTAPIAAAIAGVLATTTNYRIAFGVFAVICVVLVIPFLRVVTAAAVAEVDKPEPEETPAEPAAAEPAVEPAR